MHDTAMEFGKLFFDTYLDKATNLKIIDIGAQNVNGSLRDVAPQHNEYIGVDFVQGTGVDIVLTDPYSLPINDNTADVIVCSSCFEHSQFFWLLFNEILRILKPNGLFYLNVPSNGGFHRFPVDCWRFYPDSGLALEAWAKHNGLNTVLLESFTGPQRSTAFNDFIAVFIKDAQYADRYPTRMQTLYIYYTNGRTLENNDFSNYSEKQGLTLGQHMRRLGSIHQDKHHKLHRFPRFVRSLYSKFAK